MELSVTQENLAKALNAAGRVATAKAGLPILSNILLQTSGTRLLVAATNLEIASTQFIGAKIASQGSLTIPARLVSEFISSLPKGPVTLLVKGAQLHITSGGYSSIINGTATDEFPELPSIEEKKSIHYQINAIDFKQAVSQTIITSSNDSTRPILTGVYWHSFEGALYLAATDGYRLSERKVMGTKSDVAAIVPTSTLQEVLRLVDDSLDEVEVLFDETQVRFRVGEAEVTSRLIDGNFPDYRQLIPQKTETTIATKRSEFSRVTKIAGLFARDSGGSVIVTADEEKQSFSLHSIASELGENTSTAEATVVESGTVTLNSRYISEALSVIDSDEIVFGFSGKLAPTVLTSNEDTPNYKHIIMPLKS